MRNGSELGRLSSHKCPCCGSLLNVLEDRGDFTIFCSRSGCDEASMNDGAIGKSELEAYVRLCAVFDALDGEAS